MVKLKRTDSRVLDELFDMGSGYVLNFSDRTIAEFFEDEFGIDLYGGKYEGHGPSKAKHVRCFVELEDGYIVGQVLRRLWAYRNSIPLYGSVSAEKLTIDQKRFFELLATVEGDKTRPATDAIDRFAKDQTLEELVAAIERDIQANKPAAALDRLHTYCMKKFRHLLDKRGIPFNKEDPLNSRAGKYIKALEATQAVRPISLRIMKNGISIFDSFNAIRNNETFAHDNQLVDEHEARFIFDAITSILRLLKAVDADAFGA